MPKQSKKLPRVFFNTIVGTLCLFFFFFTAGHATAKEKLIIGETARIKVSTLPFDFIARIDTGARTSSIHALDIQVIDGTTQPKKNIGKTITFQTVTRDGKSQTVTAAIVKVSTVKNSQGIEQRYVIELPLSWKDHKKSVQVNLRDRSKMKYKLLIGRNWLAGDFLVDVDLKAEDR